MAALARAMRINRTTVYYHFKSREDLIETVKQWSSAQLAKGLSLSAPQQERIDFVTRFVLENPELIKLWIEDFIAVGDIRSRYPFWNELVRGISESFTANLPAEPADAEVYCAIQFGRASCRDRVCQDV